MRDLRPLCRGHATHTELAAEADLRPDTLSSGGTGGGVRAMACETARECVERYHSLRTVPPRLTLARVTPSHLSRPLSLRRCKFKCYPGEKHVLPL